MAMKEVILLYYKFTGITKTHSLMREQKALCNRLHLKGRIIIAKEGINGTVSGTEAATDEYIKVMHEKPEFSDMEFKLGDADSPSFPKLSIKVRAEIVSLYAPVNIENTGTYIEPDEMYKILKGEGDGKGNKEWDDVVILDGRNNYEYKIGRFHNAIELNTDNFRDFPKALEKIEHLKDKKIITYCTGGIRCEKASAYMKEKGFKNVYQLHGGIVKYIQKYPEFGFDGNCYVFDGRVSLPVNENILTACEYCGVKTARYINCANNECHIQFICCEKCDIQHESLCAQEQVKTC